MSSSLSGLLFWGKRDRAGEELGPRVLVSPPHLLGEGSKLAVVVVDAHVCAARLLGGGALVVIELDELGGDGGELAIERCDAVLEVVNDAQEQEPADREQTESGELKPDRHYIIGCIPERFRAIDRNGTVHHPFSCLEALRGRTRTSPG